jgi:hypothetical protein
MNGMLDILASIKARQRTWASRNGRTVDADGYCTCADDNMVGCRLSDAAQRDFSRGDGTELGVNGGRGKIQALHSSSALACNWFDYWRGRDLMPLSRAFGIRVPFTSLSLEQKFPTGLGGIGPNLDVLFTCADGSLFGIESKFTEPYTTTKSKTFLKPKYFLGGRSLWTEAGLPGFQAVADALRAGGHGFKVLDVSQLLKHVLGLAHSGHAWSLCCLWFDVPGSSIAVAHRSELADFQARLGNDAGHFSSMTYQELYARMVPFVGANDSDYMAYLRDRYIGA